MHGEIAYNMMMKLNRVRIAGTADEKHTIKIIESFLRDNDIKFKRNRFPIDISEVGKGRIKSGKFSAAGVPYGLSVPYNVSGKLLMTEKVEEIDSLRNKTKLNGSILLMRERPSHKIFPKLAKEGVKGIITFSRTDGRVSSLHLSSWMFEKKCIIPMIDISYEDAVRLSELTGNTVSIKGEGKTLRKTGESIIAEIKGIENTKETIVLMGHLDSVPFSPGASDNSAGIGILSELASMFKAERIRRNLVICFFSGEEWGLWGSRYFVSSNESLMKDIILGINIDVAGDKLGLNHAIVTGNSDIVSIVKAGAKYLGIGMNVSKDIYSSDNMPFSFKGVPTVNLFRAGGRPSAYVHTKDDSFEHIGTEGLSPIVEFTSMFVRSAGDSEMNMIESRIDDEIKQKTEDYFKGRGIPSDQVIPKVKKKAKK